jgi:hypothetical protein
VANQLSAALEQLRRSLAPHLDSAGGPPPI